MGAYSFYPREINIYFLQGECYIYTLPREYRKENSQQIKNAREREKAVAKQSICKVFGAIARLVQLPFSSKFKGLLNIFVGAAGFRLLLCRFCVFPLPVWAIPVVGSGWGWGRFSSSGAGAVVSAAGEALLPGRDGGPPGGSGKTGGVSRAGYRADIHTSPLPPPRTCKTSAASHVSAPSGGVAEKGGRGFYVEHYENN